MVDKLPSVIHLADGLGNWSFQILGMLLIGVVLSGVSNNPTQNGGKSRSQLIILDQYICVDFF